MLQCCCDDQGCGVCSTPMPDAATAIILNVQSGPDYFGVGDSGQPYWTGQPKTFVLRRPGTWWNGPGTKYGHISGPCAISHHDNPDQSVNVERYRVEYSFYVWRPLELVVRLSFEIRCYRTDTAFLQQQMRFYRDIDVSQQLKPSIPCRNVLTQFGYPFKENVWVGAQFMQEGGTVVMSLGV